MCVRTPTVVSIVPEGFVQAVRTMAAAWKVDRIWSLLGLANVQSTLLGGCVSGYIVLETAMEEEIVTI